MRARPCAPRRGHAQSLALGALGVVLAWVVVLGAGAAARQAAEFEFARLNRTYSQFVDQLQPVVLGPVEVLLRSPQHQLQLSRHHAWLEPAAEGTHKIRVDIELMGSGTINAVLRAAGLEGKLDDELVLPRQTLRLDGRIRLARSAAGYQIALVEGARDGRGPDPEPARRAPGSGVPADGPGAGDLRLRRARGRA